MSGFTVTPNEDVVYEVYENIDYILGYLLGADSEEQNTVGGRDRSSCQLDRRRPPIEVPTLEFVTVDIPLRHPYNSSDNSQNLLIFFLCFICV